MKKLQYAVLAVISLLAASAWADSLELKNGSLIKGTYVGGTESQVSFRVGSSVQQYDVADIASIKFESSENSRSSGGPGFATRDDRDSRRNRDLRSDDAERNVSPRDEDRSISNRRPSYSNSNSNSNSDRITVPTGTRVTVRTIDAIDSDKNRVGDRFTASLEQP